MDDKVFIKQFLKKALKEDVGKGDYTSLAIVKRSSVSCATLLVKEPCILAGLSILKTIFFEIDKSAYIELFYKDGDYCEGRNNVAARIRANTLKLLKVERLVLNILQRMSGIATKTAQFVEKVKGTKAKILDTRKTTPLFRYFEKKAVQIGGGQNHRFGLFDMILIKDNHIAYAGSIEKAIDNIHNFLKKKKLNLKIEIEAKSLECVKKIINKGGIDIIMLDNFTIEETKKAVEIINEKYLIESSGGINLSNVRDYALCGVDFISVGELTHSVKAIDMSLKIVNV